jgi:uncharacterized protein (DUF2252 family)
MLVALAACAPDDARQAEVVEVLTRADEALIRSRPQLAASKYRAMAGSLYAFYRGTFPLYLHDARHGTVGGGQSRYFAEAYPMSLGDAHPENFGTLLARDGVMALEVNDLDAADRYPYLWEARRLAVGLCIAARASNPTDDAARSAARAAERDVALAMATTYAAEIQRLAAGGARDRFVDPAGSAFLEDLFDRARDDVASREELSELTVVEDGVRRLKRGPIDPDDAENVFVDAAALALEALPATLDVYRGTLASPPPRGFFDIKDAVREFGSGIASRPRLRMVLLVEGPTGALEDDVLLELKEIGDSGARPVGRPTVSADDVAGRVLLAKGTAWTRSDADPLWGMADLFGLTVQVKGEFEAHKTIRVARMADGIGTPEALAALGDRLGLMLARVHAGSEDRWPGTTAAIAEATAREGFAAEQADVAVAYADVVEADFARFQRALEELGPRLGVPEDPADAADADIAALLGTPPPTDSK